MGPGSGIDVNDDENPPTVASFDCDKGLISVYPYPSDFPCRLQINIMTPVR